MLLFKSISWKSGHGTHGVNLDLHLGANESELLSSLGPTDSLKWLGAWDMGYGWLVRKDAPGM